MISVLVFVSSGLLFLVVPLGFTDAKYLIFFRAPEVVVESALNCEPTPILCPLRESCEPELETVFPFFFNTLSGVSPLGIEDKIKLC